MGEENLSRCSPGGGEKAREGRWQEGKQEMNLLKHQWNLGSLGKRPGEKFRKKGKVKGR